MLDTLATSSILKVLSGAGRPLGADADAVEPVGVPAVVVLLALWPAARRPTIVFF